MADTSYRFLALCARAECRAAHCRQLAQEAARFAEWDKVSALAETHGLAPLLYVHLKAVGVQPPPVVRRELQGLYLRHRRANQIRTHVLGDVLAATSAAGIQAVVLKGAALSHIVYPEPGLRPMSDLDILVSESDLWRARGLLTELGFSAPASPESTPLHRHLPAATIRKEGLLVQVEIHHKLLSSYFDNAVSYLGSWLTRIKPTQSSRASTELNGLTEPPRPFTLAGVAAYTLGHEDMLGHLCRHLVSHVNVWDFGRLIWVADIVSFAERFASEVDWERLRRRYPAVFDTLSLLHFMTPLSDELIHAADLQIGHAPDGIGIEFKGWPRASRTHWRERGCLRVLRDTLVPSEWWLRLRCNLGSARPLFWYRWVRHPLHILGQVARTLLESLGWPSHRELAGQVAPR